MRYKSLFFIAIVFLVSCTKPEKQSIQIPENLIRLTSEKIDISWLQEGDGWRVYEIKVGDKKLSNPKGYYDILKHVYADHQAVERVQEDLEGRPFTFYPSEAIQQEDGSILFKHSLRVADVESIWKIDPEYPTDILVTTKIISKEKGTYSIGSPTIAVLDTTDLSWGMIPGNWYGTGIQKDFQLAKRYSMGIPAVPCYATEKNTMTLSPMLTTKDKITLAVIPEPGTAADPWEYDKSTRSKNKVAMTLINRHNELCPTAYSPVLGQEGSKLDVGDSASFSFRYSIQDKDWFPVFSHVVEDIYQLPGLLDIQKSKMSLSERVSRLQVFLRDDKRSSWNIWESMGYEIGANGTKIADAGTMLMVAEAGNDSVMKSRIPYVRNYKLAQQQTKPGFFQGAALGEYAYQDGVESEKGNWIEPLFTSYYTIVEIGNMLLFNPEDEELKERMRLAAAKLLKWQHDDGSFDVAYDRFSHQLSFPDLQDFRPTWYGLLVAYKILGDKQYMKAAEKGAKWLIKNGVNKGYYLGVCGDARNIWDFATAQCSQAFLELYSITNKEIYKKAAIEAAKVYSTSIFTHPIASNQKKLVNGKKFEDWQINQVGLSVEHIRGTASSGPILISSFAGLFLRIYEYTNEEVFLTMARGAARGRNAYVDPESGKSLYYWCNLNRKESRVNAFPWHAYWQIGWITDYLLAEAHYRSTGQIEFPVGFMTPKVGPHISYGYAPGKVFGEEASLLFRPGMIECDNPNFEYITALAEDKEHLFVMVLNQSPKEGDGEFSLDAAKIKAGIGWGIEEIKQGNDIQVSANNHLNIKIPAWRMSVISLKLVNK